MPDVTGAVAAIRARIEDEDAGWHDAPIVFPNDGAPEPWPPVDPDTLQPLGWVAVEVIWNGSERRAIGSPGDQLWLYRGLILAHVFVPTGTGTATAYEHAVAIGELFRNAAFYRDEGAGTEIRSSSPWVDGGGVDAENGNYFRVTMTCPFEFFYRG